MLAPILGIFGAVAAAYGCFRFKRFGSKKDELERRQPGKRLPGEEPPLEQRRKDDDVGGES